MPMTTVKEQYQQKRKIARGFVRIRSNALRELEANRNQIAQLTTERDHWRKVALAWDHAVRLLGAQGGPYPSVYCGLCVYYYEVSGNDYDNTDICNKCYKCDKTKASPEGNFQFDVERHTEQQQGEIYFLDLEQLPALCANSLSSHRHE